MAKGKGKESVAADAAGEEVGRTYGRPTMSTRSSSRTPPVRGETGTNSSEQRGGGHVQRARGPTSSYYSRTPLPRRSMALGTVDPHRGGMTISSRRGGPSIFSRYFSRPVDHSRGPLRVTFDGSVRNDGRTGSSGFVVRSYSGLPLIAGNIVFALSSKQKTQEVELRAAWEGLRAVQMGLEGVPKRDVWLEGDSQTVIDWINGVCKAPQPFHSYLEDIESWRINYFDPFSATHVLRKGNKAADCLAGSADSTSRQIRSFNFPDLLLDLLDADANYARKKRTSPPACFTSF